MNQERIELETEILWITAEKYEYFMSNGKLGHDGKDLYMHLQYTARLQQTNQVKANDVYLMKGLCWGEKRLKAAKAFLSKSGLLGYKQKRNEDGTMGETYLVVKATISPVGSKTTPPVNRRGASPPHRSAAPPVPEDKCFNKQVKCFNEQRKGAAAPPPKPVPVWKQEAPVFASSQYDEVMAAFSAEYERQGGEPYIGNVARDRKELKRLFSQGIQPKQIIKSIPAFLSFGRDPGARRQEQEFWSDKRTIRHLVAYWGHDRLVAARSRKSAPKASLADQLKQDEAVRQREAAHVC